MLKNNSSCAICKDDNISESHYESNKHTTNLVLYEYRQNCKKFYPDRNGIVVSCEVSCPTFNKAPNDNNEGQIKISTKPGKKVTFNFGVQNNTDGDVWLVTGVVLAHKSKYFSMGNGVELGHDPVILKPKHKLSDPVCVSFLHDEYGRFDVAIMFFFTKQNTEEKFIIIREMVVFVEPSPTLEAVTDTVSPYTNIRIFAETYVPAKKRKRHIGGTYPIDPELKPIFANDLKVRKHASPEDVKRTGAIKAVFAAGVTTNNYTEFFHNLLYFEETLVGINLTRYNMERRTLTQSQTNKKTFMLNVPGLAEKRPSILPDDRVTIRFHGDEKVQYGGIVTKIDGNTAYISKFSQDFISAYTPSRLVDVRLHAPRVVFQRLHAAVRSAAATHPHVLFPTGHAECPPLFDVPNWFNEKVGLNPEQALAVRRICAGPTPAVGSAPYILHGPPGTGKTVTLVEAILQLVRSDPSHRILVCTDTNASADHVARALVLYHHTHFANEEYFLLRTNSRHRDWASLPKELVNYSNGDSFLKCYRVKNETLNLYKIVVTTLLHSAIYNTGSSRVITHLIVDEAGQASEPATLVPLPRLAAAARLVLAGDHRQLGPVVLSQTASKIGLGKSLMQRLIETSPLYGAGASDQYTLMLRRNFRSCADLLDIPSRRFYNGGLRSEVADDPLSSVDPLKRQVKSRALMFHGVSAQEQRDGSSPSCYNSAEVEVVGQYVRALTGSCGVQSQDIGIIAPYLKQVSKIKAWLQTKGYGRSIEVGTVESFQGKEKRVIIVSTVRATASLLAYDAKYKLGFLVDERRFNVAVTRAKAKLIIVGNPLCLSKDEKWLEYMQRCRQLGTYFGFDAVTERGHDVMADIVKHLNIMNLLSKEKEGDKKANAA